MSHKVTIVKADTNLVIDNDLNGRYAVIDCSKPLTLETLRKIANVTWPNDECDALGGHGSQVDPVKYAEVLKQAEALR